MNLKMHMINGRKQKLNIRNGKKLKLAKSLKNQEKSLYLQRGHHDLQRKKIFCKTFQVNQSNK